LLRDDQHKLEKKKNENLRALKWESMELRLNMRQYNEHVRAKIKRRKDENARKKKKKMEEDLQQKLEESARELQAPSPPYNFSPPYCLTPSGSSTDQSKKEKVQSKKNTAPMPASVGVRIGPELMNELGLNGVEVPKVDESWGKVSRTALSLHRKWDRERHENQHKKPPKSAVSDPGGYEPAKSPDRIRTSTKSHQSYFQSCLARPFSYEEFADRKISCKENEQMWKIQLRDPHPRMYKRFTVSGEENSIAQRQFTERNIARAKQSRTEKRNAQTESQGVSDKITRMKFTSSKMLEERAELDRKQEEGRLQTDKRIRRHKYRDKNISVADISKERPSYLRYRYTGTKNDEVENWFDS
jgi:hypothetical protein